jgi:hypothetical protein
MKSVYDDLIRGTARERLSVLSDLLSVTGVSLGAALAPVLAIKSITQLGLASIVGIIISALIFFAGLAMLLLLIISINDYMCRGFDDSFSSKLIRVSLWSVSAALYLMIISAVVAFFAAVRW